MLLYTITSKKHQTPGFLFVPQYTFWFLQKRARTMHRTNKGSVNWSHLKKCIIWGIGQLKWTELEAWNEWWHRKWVKMSNSLKLGPHGLCTVIPQSSSHGPKGTLSLQPSNLDGVSSIHIYSVSMLFLSFPFLNTFWHLYVLSEKMPRNNMSHLKEMMWSMQHTLCWATLINKIP